MIIKIKISKLDVNSFLFRRENKMLFFNTNSEPGKQSETNIATGSDLLIHVAGIFTFRFSLQVCFSFPR